MKKIEADHFGLGGYVGPGFDFSDFRMAKDDAEMRSIIAQQGEEFAACS
jgi:predicted cupin superfamily sugar epimerase